MQKTTDLVLPQEATDSPDKIGLFDPGNVTSIGITVGKSPRLREFGCFNRPEFWQIRLQKPAIFVFDLILS
jgi:hypothetical protein